MSSTPSTTTTTDHSTTTGTPTTISTLLGELNQLVTTLSTNNNNTLSSNIVKEGVSSSQTHTFNNLPADSTIVYYFDKPHIHTQIITNSTGSTTATDGTNWLNHTITTLTATTSLINPTLYHVVKTVDIHLDPTKFHPSLRKHKVFYNVSNVNLSDINKPINHPDYIAAYKILHDDFVSGGFDKTRSIPCFDEYGNKYTIFKSTNINDIKAIQPSNNTDKMKTFSNVSAGSNYNFMTPIVSTIF
jgi:hypothetical protein